MAAHAVLAHFLDLGGLEQGLIQQALDDANGIVARAAAFLLSACGIGQHAQTINAVPQDNIVDLHTGQKLTPQQLLAKLSTQPRVIVGEKHDNLQHHQIEQWLVEQLPRQRTQGSVLMEMITPNNSLVNAASSAPCIFGLTIYTEPVRLLLRVAGRALCPAITLWRPRPEQGIAP